MVMLLLSPCLQLTVGVADANAAGFAASSVTRLLLASAMTLSSSAF
jgi:hypothetical protein